MWTLPLGSWSQYTPSCCWRKYVSLGKWLRGRWRGFKDCWSKGIVHLPTLLEHWSVLRIRWTWWPNQGVALRWWRCWEYKTDCLLHLTIIYTIISLQYSPKIEILTLDIKSILKKDDSISHWYSPITYHTFKDTFINLIINVGRDLYSKSSQRYPR